MEKVSREAHAYNTPHPVSWGRSWMSDPPGEALSEHWEELIASFRSRAPLGKPAPDFFGELLDGGQFRLSTVLSAKAVLLVFGSFACPPCVTNIRANTPSLVSLYAEYGESVEFCYVYTREAHPGRHMRPHSGMAEKRANAERLCREEKITFPVVVDTLEGEIHQRYADPQFNNPVFLINRAGIVVYKSAWLDTSELPQVLDDLKLWRGRAAIDKTIKKTFSERIRALREPYDPNASERIKRLLPAIGLEPHELGSPPGLLSSELSRPGDAGKAAP